MHSVYLLFILLASTFKRTHWLVPGYLLGQVRIFCKEYYHDGRAKPRIAATRIGVIRVSCSCGNGAPSTLEIHESPLLSSLEIIVVSLGLYGLVTNSCNRLVICNKDVSTSNSNPGLVMTRGVNYWEFVSQKTGPDSLGIRARLTIG